MPIPLYGAEAQGPHIYALDDRGVVMDGAALDGTGGNPYVCTMLSVRFTASSYSRFRRLVQSVEHEGHVTVSLVPWRDGQETGQTITRTLARSDPSTITLPCAVDGSEFQMAITLSDFDTTAEIGTGDVTVIARRSQR